MLITLFVHVYLYYFSKFTSTEFLKIRFRTFQKFEYVFRRCRLRTEERTSTCNIGTTIDRIGLFTAMKSDNILLCLESTHRSRRYNDRSFAAGTLRQYKRIRFAVSRLRREWDSVKPSGRTETNFCAQTLRKCRSRQNRNVTDDCFDSRNLHVPAALRGS